MADEETANYGTSQAAETGANGVGGGDSVFNKNEMSEQDLIKLELLQGLISKNVNLSDAELAELTGFESRQIKELRKQALINNMDDSSTPLSWDYVLAFDVGDKEQVKKPSAKDKKNRPDDDNDPEWDDGMAQDKYFGQIFNNFWQRLESAKLSVEAYRSDDKDEMFLIVGITEKNLKYWADERDADLLIDPKGGVEVGRTKEFPLARRTILKSDNDDDHKEDRSSGETIDLSNWKFLYGEYSQQANEKVYKHYKRLKDRDDLMTPFDEKTRLRIIYESIISDTNEGGAEIKIANCLLNKKHPLKAVFPLHDEERLEYFNNAWIKNWNPMKLMWCPLDEVRDYFGEPVAFYFAFLVFYLKWLIAPAIIGFIFFVWQMVVDEVAVTGIPFLCFFMIFWSVAFVDFWARAESRYRLMWGMTKFQQKAVARPQFEGEWEHDSVTGLWVEEFSLFARACRIGAIYTFVSIWLSACVVSVIAILLQRDADPNNLPLKIGLGVANAVMIFVFDAIYKLVSRYGNEWENHRTEQDFQNAMIYKSFSFKFVNSFASLFYLGFIRPAQKGLYYYVHFYTNACGSAAYFMSKALGNIDPTENDTKDYGNIGEWFKDNTDANNADYANCKQCDLSGLCKECIDYVQDDENNNAAWSISTNGFYPLGGDTTLCPTGSPEEGGSMIDETTNQRYDSNGKCLGSCDLTQTLIDQNEAILGELRIQLLTLFLTAIVIQNTLEVGIPLLCQKIKKDKAEKAAREQGIVKSEVEKQTEKDRYENTIDDMSELIIQFGYVTLFVMAFPITPLLAIVNNVLEMKVDATNLVATSQRPDPNGAFGLGSWNGVLGFFSIVAVATNVALITWRTKLVTIVLGDNPSGQWIFFSILSIALGIVVGMEKWIIPDVPVAVELAIERQRLVENVLILGAGVDTESDEPPEGDDDGGIGFDPSLEFIDVETLPDIPKKLNVGDDTKSA